MLWHIPSLIRCAVGAHGVLAVALAHDVRNLDAVKPPSSSNGLTHTALFLDINHQTGLRDLLLRCAVNLDSDCRLARWHLGQLQVGNQWMSIEQAERLAAVDPEREQYRLLREQAAVRWKCELDLSRWCRRRQWDDEERLHLSHLLMNRASSQAAKKESMRKLGLKFHRGQFWSDDAIARYEQGIRESTRAMKEWGPRIQKWRDAIETGQRRQRVRALEDLRDVRDLAAIPVLESVLSTRSERFATEVISILKCMPEHEATLSLLRHVVVMPHSTVYEEAMEELKRRPLHDYAPTLLHGLVAPVQSMFRITTSPIGTVRHEHSFFREGATGNLVATQDFVAALRDGAALAQTGRLYADRRWDIRTQIARASRRAMYIERNIVQANAAIRECNKQMYVSLRRTTGMELPNIPSVWWEWWQEYNEVHVRNKPTYSYEDRHVQYYGLPMTMIGAVEVTETSCFAAGTLVRTQTGLMAIQRIQAGDRVLSQNPETGELAYKMVVRTTVRPPSGLLTISAAGSEITTTKGHPFWVNGLGWRMAKRLRVGDRLHSVGGSRGIDQIVTATPAQAYNLIVADFGTYFVSKANLLVHDNTYRTPTTALTPGLVASGRLPTWRR